MKIEDLKTNFATNATKLIDAWFDTPTLSDNIFKGIGKTIIQSNINKYDNVINLFVDENGDLNIEQLIENVISQFPEKIEIDIQKLTNMPFPKILILTRNDIINLIKS